MPADRDTIQFTADRGDMRLRLDQMIVRHVREVSRLSRTGAQGWIRTGAVAVDGVCVTRPSIRVPPGAIVTVVLPESAARRVAPRPEALDVQTVYEDEWLIAINKPAGQVVHPSYKNQTGTLLNALLWKIRDRPTARVGLINRLDKGTSGLVLVALDGDVHATIQRDAAAGAVEKQYLAVVRGTPRPRRGSIELPLSRDPRDRRRVVAAAGGMYSKTLYEVVRSSHGFSLLQCRLATGRTHQIRVHLAGRGWPIVGDSHYGVPFDGLTHQALHAWRMTLRHPTVGKLLSLEAPLPPDWPSSFMIHDS